MIRRAFADLPTRQVHYRRAGEGPPLLMIHASPGSSKQLEGKITALAATRSVIAPDTPGNGDSTPLLVAAPEMADYAAAALEFLNKPDPKFPLYALPRLSEAASKLMRRAAEPASSLDGAARNRNADLALVEFQKMAGVVYAEKAAELAAREASANQINSSGNSADSALHPLPPVSTN